MAELKKGGEVLECGFKFRFEAAQLRDFRRRLFIERVSPQQFFNYVMAQTVFGDERCGDMIKEAAVWKMEQAKIQGDFGRLNADDLYDMIENNGFTMPKNEEDDDHGE